MQVGPSFRRFASSWFKPSIAHQHHSRSEALSRASFRIRTPALTSRRVRAHTRDRLPVLARRGWPLDSRGAPPRRLRLAGRPPGVRGVRDPRRLPGLADAVGTAPPRRLGAVERSHGSVASGLPAVTRRELGSGRVGTTAAAPRGIHRALLRGPAVPVLVGAPRRGTRRGAGGRLLGRARAALSQQGPPVRAHRVPGVVPLRERTEMARVSKTRRGQRRILVRAWQGEGRRRRAGRPATPRMRVSWRLRVRDHRERRRGRRHPEPTPTPAQAATRRGRRRSEDTTARLSLPWGSTRCTIVIG